MADERGAEGRDWKRIRTDGLTLDDIYYFFKPAKQTNVWKSGDEVNVSWEHFPGRMRWFLEGGVVKFEFVSGE